jgi:hypothetical protein
MSCSSPRTLPFLSGCWGLQQWQRASVGETRVGCEIALTSRLLARQKPWRTLSLIRLSCVEGNIHKSRRHLQLSAAPLIAPACARQAAFDWVASLISDVASALPRREPCTPLAYAVACSLGGAVCAATVCAVRERPLCACAIPSISLSRPSRGRRPVVTPAVLLYPMLQGMSRPR